MFNTKKSYIKKCELLSQKFISLGVEFSALAKSIEQHGLTEDTKLFIDKRIKKYLED